MAPIPPPTLGSAPAKPRRSSENGSPVSPTKALASRDVVIVGVVAIVSLSMGPRTFKPSIWGKTATATYIVTSVIVMYFNYRQEQSILVDVFVWLSLTFTILSAADYFMKLRRLVNAEGG